MNETIYKKLEFDVVRAALAGCCSTSLGKRSAMSLAPTGKAHLIGRWLQQVQELDSVADAHGLPPLGGVHDIGDAVRASAFPTPLEADALANIAETLAATGPMGRWLEKIAEAAPMLGVLRERVVDLTPIAEAIHESIDPRGTVRDTASAKLSSIRHSIEDAHRRIRSVFDNLLRGTSSTRLLQYSGATFHNDRMVLPLKAEQRGRIAGIIHRTSDSGATLFVEPSESVELNNSIVRLRDAESKEITRILQELSRRINANAPAIHTTLHAMGVLDLVAAKLRYAKSRHCIYPKIDDQGVLDLHDARHPVLLEMFEHAEDASAPPRCVVPIDVRLGEDFDILVITGPNTGGKTVALKTVGLIALMAQCGIPIPAGEGSIVPVYRDIFLDIGDEQSLQQSLSTFSSHLRTVLDLLRNATPRSLVLIDELGAGTDPDEGAAIGQAVIAELLRLGSRAIVTTHLSVLKAIAFTSPRVDNAAVEFDPVSLRPTYRVRLGEPGNSNAMIIAKRLGMPARLIKQAKGFLADKTRALNKAISSTLDSRRAAERARKSARTAELEANQRRDEHHRMAEQLESARNAFDSWTRWVHALEPGDVVFLKTLQRTGKVVRIRLQQQSAVVSAGAFDIEVPLGDLETPPAEPE